MVARNDRRYKLNCNELVQKQAMSYIQKQYFTHYMIFGRGMNMGGGFLLIDITAPLDAV